LIGLDGQLDLRPAREQRLQGADAFDPRQLVTQAEMDSSPEGQVPVRPPLKVELFRTFVRLRVQAV
jgi:hypothetical protein